MASTASGYSNDYTSSQLDQLFAGYDYDYFGGGQVSIYIGDVFIDEIVRLGYDFQHQKTPIYGYASHYFDTVAWGQQIVSGQFAINYKEEAYLQIVLSHLSKTDATSGPFLGTDIGGGKAVYTTVRSNIETIIRNGLNNTGGGLDTQEGTKLMEMSIIEQLRGFIDDDSTGKEQAGSDFEDIAEGLEDQLWKSPDGLVSGSPNSKSFSGTLQSPTNYPNPFDIYLVYGDYTNPKANHTSKKISEVHLVGQSQTVEIDGAPIYELYSFLARGINLATS